jgi:glutaconyl-CoA/methylmalonyl-CoA decarboxylase subunit gamma
METYPCNINIKTGGILMKKFLIKVNGNQYEVEVEEVKDNSAAIPAETPKTATASKPSAPSPVVPAPPAPKAVSAEKFDAASAGGTIINSPMPGTILNVLVNPGDLVKKGQVLLILEAMKMENEIVSPKDGKIASINVEKAKAVNVGDILISIL